MSSQTHPVDPASRHQSLQDQDSTLNLGQQQTAGSSPAPRPWRLAVLVSALFLCFAHGTVVLSAFLLILPVVAMLMVPPMRWRRWSWWLMILGLAGFALWLPWYRVRSGWMPAGAQMQIIPSVVQAWCLAGMAWFPLALVASWGVARWPLRISGAAVLLGLVVLLPNLPWIYRPQWTHPQRVPVADTVETVIQTRAGWLPTRLWWPGVGTVAALESDQPDGVVLLVHGVGANQDYLASRAALLNQCGWAVLTCDLPGHGRASPAAVTYGLREASALAEVYAQRAVLVDPQLPVVVYGMSMGGATAALAIDHCPGVRGLIIESGYADLGTMIDATLDPTLAAVARVVSTYGIGVDPRAVRPVGVPWVRNDRPLLVGWGTADGLVPPEHTKAFMSAAPSLRWVSVPGAIHDELIDRVEWQEAVRQTLQLW